MWRNLIEGEKLMRTDGQRAQQVGGLTSGFQKTTGQVLVQAMIARDTKRQFTRQGRIAGIKTAARYDID